MLHFYSTRMVNNLWLLDDGSNVEVEFMNAFGLPKTEKMRIINFGYRQESRLLNVDAVKYKSDRHIYINQSRNVFVHQEMNEVLNRVLKGQELEFRPQ